jgi:hypothetical protein
MLSACYSVPSDMVAVTVGAGPFEASKVKDCKPSSDRGFWTNDHYEYFPTSEREWDATGQKGSDAKPYTAVTKDNVQMYIPITVRFTLITDCNTLKDFYVRYIRRYGAHFNSDGTYNDQWETLLRKLIADPTGTTLNSITQGYNWREVWNDPSTRVKIQASMTSELSNPDSSAIDGTAKGHFFDGISVLVGQPQPVNPALADAVASEQTKVAEAQAAKAQADADRATAEAQIAVARAEAAKQRAEIDGYRLPGMTAKDALRAYNEAKCIESGCNPYQPQYVLPGAGVPSSTPSN